jgi:hypothetical protein
MIFREALFAAVIVGVSTFARAAEDGDTDKPAMMFTATGFTINGSKAAWGDFDNDGFVDLFSGGIVWRNEGGKRFTRFITLGGEGIWGDFDNDGYLDVFLYSHRTVMHNQAGKSFKEVASMIPPLPMSVTRGAAWGDFNGDSFLDLYVGAYEGGPGYQPDVILLSEGGKKFKIAWQQAEDVDPSRGVTAADFDEDGDLDVYVSNYRLEQNQLWRNDGTGKFTNVGQTHGVAGTDDGWTYSYGHTIGSAWGDLDSDGHLDLFVGNFSHPPAWQDRPRFYRNLGQTGDYKFEDLTAQAGLTWQESFASPALGDVNNDGLLDLYFTTVYGGDHNVLYINQGDFRFTDVTAISGIAETPIYQAAFADFDNDGDLDLATNGTIYRNENTSGNWLKVRLHGDGVKINRSAIGAQVRVSVGNRTITRQIESGTGEGNQNDLTLHFGLGEATGKLALQIRWPGGKVDKAEANVNQTVEFTYAP